MGHRHFNGLKTAGLFAALVLGIWWKRTTSTGAICGMIAGFGVCLFYLVTTRYFPGFGVKYAGMSSLLNPITGAPVVNIATAMALPSRYLPWLRSASMSVA